MNDKIREVALRVAREMSYHNPEESVAQEYRLEFLTRCLQELSKDVEPIAIRKWSEIDDDYVYSNGIDFPTYRDFGWEPVYLHPPLTEQDKLDAARYRCIRGIKHLESFVALNQLDYSSDEEFDAAIDQAMENGK